mgnify:CR=1 FL=1
MCGVQRALQRNIALAGFDDLFLEVIVAVYRRELRKFGDHIIRGVEQDALLGFTHLVKLEDYVQDMQAINHDYVLMGMDLMTDEEYAGMG